MKHEWRKKEKQYYLPKQQPEIVELPAFNFLCIEGQGNPNREGFGEYVEALYALSYGIKMGLKKIASPPDYQDYTVYPLEGVWDISEEAKKNYSGKLNKDDLVFKLMIRQPDFVSPELFENFRQEVLKKKTNARIAEVKFERIEEGPCIQMLHLGSFDSEPESFKRMEEFAALSGRQRSSKKHREIYLSDSKKVAPDKLKTVLRFKIKS